MNDNKYNMLHFVLRKQLTHSARLVPREGNNGITFFFHSPPGRQAVPIGGDRPPGPAPSGPLRHAAGGPSDYSSGLAVTARGRTVGMARDWRPLLIGWKIIRLMERRRWNGRSGQRGSPAPSRSRVSVAVERQPRIVTAG